MKRYRALYHVAGGHQVMPLLINAQKACAIMAMSIMVMSMTAAGKQHALTG